MHLSSISNIHRNWCWKTTKILKCSSIWSEIIQCTTIDNSLVSPNCVIGCDNSKSMLRNIGGPKGLFSFIFNCLIGGSSMRTALSSWVEALRSVSRPLFGITVVFSLTFLHKGVAD